MQKAHDASKNAWWRNYPNVSTPIVQDELNRIESTIDIIDDRVVEMDTTKANQSDMLTVFYNVTLDEDTGVFTFYRKNGTTVTIDTLLEKIIMNWYFDNDPTSEHYQQMVLTLKDGTVQYIDLSAFVTQFEFVDSVTIHWVVNNNGEVVADIINGSVTEDKLQPNFLADCRAAKTAAETAETNAETAESGALGYKREAEAWAIGTKDGVPVTPTDLQYHNSAYYWAQQARSIVGDKVDSFNGRTGTVVAEDGDYESGMIVPEAGSISGQVPVVRNVGTGQDVKLRYVNEDLDIGLKPHIIVISETGSTVRLVKGGTTIYATETSTEHFECDVTEFGTWTVHSVLNGDDSTVSLVVDTVKIYTVDDSHYHADITVTYPTGGTCSCSKSGETTLYATGSPYTFTVHTAGTWTITVSANGNTFTEDVVISASGQTETLTIPNGSTVTPTDDVPTLIACAGIGNSEITTVSGLLADTTTLLAVINSTNAIDYLVRSTGFTGIALVPTMTSNTTPSGECFSDGSPVYVAYKAFDGDLATYWAFNDANAGHYLGYIFPEAKVVRAVGVFTGNTGTTSASAYVSSFKVQASNDGTTWTDLTDAISITPADGLKKVSFANNTAYTRYRILTLSSQTYTYLNTLQFYSDVNICEDSTAMSYIGLNNYAANTLLGSNNPSLVPVMTSNTTPSGEASADSIYSSDYPAYAAFNSNMATAWTSLNSAFPHWLAYKFDTPKTVRCFSLRNSGVSTNYTYAIKDFIVQGSNDNGSSWVDIYSGTHLNNYDTERCVYTFDNQNSYSMYRLYITSGHHQPSAQRCDIGELQFYAEKYDSLIWLNSICNSTYFESVLNVKVPTMTSNTTPSGIAFANGTYNASYPAYLAFNNNESDGWLSSAGVGNKIVGYIFTEAKVCKCIKNANLSVRVTALDSDWYIQGSNDTTTGTDGTWTYLGMTKANSTATLVRVTTAVLNNNSYKAYRIYVRIASGSDNFYVSSRELQFYGREDV